MKKILVTIAITALLTVIAIYGRWIVSDLVWIHGLRVESEKQAAFVAGQQDAVRQIKSAQGK